MARDPHDEPTATLVEGGRHASERRKRPARPPTERPAPQMLGRYVILSELGRGGMSTVYVAYDPELDRRVALKVVRGAQLSELHRARLHREAQALARLSHPSVVTVFDVGDIDDDTFVAMELVDGVSLREWIKQPRTWREVVKVVVAAGRGLAAAHAAGIVHRDVKPDNIVIAANGAVKLVDFGLARDLGDKTLDSEEFAREEPSLPPEPRESHDDLLLSASSSGNLAARPLEAITQMGFVVGTPAYMPPEQLSKSPEADERSDQFSLCATLYEGLYQKKPFKTSKKIALDHREALTVAERPGHDTRTLAAPPPRNTDVPAWLQRVVIRGLAVDPAARYPSVDALLAAIDRDPGRTLRRTTAAVGVVLGAAAIATLVTWRLMPSQQQAASCGTGGDRVAAIWNMPARVELERVAASRGASGASAALGVFASRVDQYVADWQAMYQEACQATRVRAAQSEEALDLRMTCLDHRLGELGALVEVMHDADADALSKAGEVAESLTPIAECADLQALKQVVRRPTDPASVARLAAVDGDLAHVQALYAVGDITKTLALVDRVIADARALGYAPQLARALYWRGRSMADRDGGPDAEAMFDQTFAAALSAGEDTMAADAAARIAQEALWSARLPEFERWSRITRALADRSHAAGVVRFVDQLGCMANHYSGKVHTRLACLRELAARKDGTPNEWLVTTLGIAASEAGEPADAIHWLEQGVALARADNGADHPRTLEMRAYLCNGLNELGDYTRAADECRDALTRLQKVAPDATKLIARLKVYLAHAEIRRHHVDVARPLLQEAEKDGDDEIKLAAKGDLSELGGVHGDVAAAIAEHREGLAEMIKAFAQYNPHHPNIIAERHELGAALFAHGDYAAAADELTKADTEADENEMSPFEIAQIRFARAQALAKLPHHDAALVGRLAQNALDIYVRHAPDTERFRSEREAIEQWLAGLH